MYTSMRRHQLLNSDLFRWGARASAAVLVVIWLSMVLAEAVSTRFAMPSMLTVFQGLALAVAFVGYAVGLRNELAGGVLAIMGTLAFFAVHALTLGTLPGIAAALFAAPGVLYLLAHYSEGTEGSSMLRQP